MDETGKTSQAGLVDTPQATGWLGIAAGLVIVVASLVTAIPYVGSAGERYSPLNHFISELGELGQSHLAIVFNVGLVIGAAGLALFTWLVSRAVRAPYGRPFAVFGVISGIGGGLAGVFPMDFLGVHRAVATVFFVTGWVLVAIFSVWQLRDRTAPSSRWLLAIAALVVVSFVSFLVSMATAPDIDSFAVAASRPSPIWMVPALEWLALLSLLAWFALLGWSIVRRQARD